MERWSLSSADANSRLLLALRILPSVDLLSFDPTTLHERSAASRFAGVRVLSAMRALEIWENQVVSIVASKASAQHEGAAPNALMLRASIGGGTVAIVRHVRALIAKSIYDVSTAAPESWQPTTDLPPPFPPPSPPSPPPLPLPSEAFADSEFKAAAAEDAKVFPLSSALQPTRLDGANLPSPPSPPPPSPPCPSAPPPSPPPPPFWSLGAQSPPPPTLRTHPASLNLESAEMLADLITSVAHQFNVSIPAKEAHVAAVAGSVLIRSMRADEKLLLGDRARRTVAIDTDGAWASATLMSKWRQVGEWMAQHTMSLGHGHISFLHFAYATSPLALQVRAVPLPLVRLFLLSSPPNRPPATCRTPACTGARSQHELPRTCGLPRPPSRHLLACGHDAQASGVHVRYKPCGKGLSADGRGGVALLRADAPFLNLANHHPVWRHRPRLALP